VFLFSRDLKQLSREIRENFRTGGGQMHIVLDADSAPAGTVDAGLDRNNRAFTERRFDGLCQTRCFVDLEAQPVSETVAERVAVATVLDVAARQTIGFLSLHSRSHRLRRDYICVANDVI